MLGLMKRATPETIAVYAYILAVRALPASPCTAYFKQAFVSNTP